jgi:hypothetical protein
MNGITLNQSGLIPNAEFVVAVEEEGQSTVQRRKVAAGAAMRGHWVGGSSDSSKQRGWL